MRSWTIGLLCLCLACGQETNADGKSDPNPIDQMHTLGYAPFLIGLKSSEITSSEPWALLEKDSELWMLEQRKGPAPHLDAYLTFDKDELYEVTIDWWSANATEHQELYDRLLKQLDAQYGKSSPAEGFATWTTSSKAGRLIEITLLDERPELDTTRIMLNWLEYYDKPYVD